MVVKEHRKDNGTEGMGCELNRSTLYAWNEILQPFLKVNKMLENTSS